MNLPAEPDASRSVPSALGREALLLVVAIAFGLLAMPPLLWLAGTRAFGPYAAGGLRELLVNFFRGLAQGSLGFWMVALGPYAIALAVRALAHVARSARQGG